MFRFDLDSPKAGMAALGNSIRRGRWAVAVCALILLSFACSTQAEITPSPTPTPKDQTPRPASGTATATQKPSGTNAAAGKAGVVLADFVPKVFVTGPGETALHEGAFGEALVAGSEIVTDKSGQARLVFSDGTTVRVGPNGRMVLTSQKKSSGGGWLTQMNLWVGQVWVMLQKGELSVETPVGVAAVRGSFLSVTYFPGDPDDPTDDQMIVTCLEGQCSISTDAGKIEFGTGKKVIVKGVGNPPGEPVTMTQEDFDEWLANNPEVLIILQARTAEPTESEVTETPEPGGSTLPTAAPAANAAWPSERARQPASLVLVIGGVLVSVIGRRWLKRR